MTVAEHTNPMEEPITQPEALAYMPLLAMTFTSLLAAEVLHSSYSEITVMPMFMGIWLIQFSLIKLFDLQGFVERFSRYDVISSRVQAYGYVYPFIELALGLAFLGNYYPFYSSLVLLVISALSLLNVLLQRGRASVYCACMGSLVRVPLGRITAIENMAMLLMAAAHMAQHMNYWNNNL